MIKILYINNILNLAVLSIPLFINRNVHEFRVNQEMLLLLLIIIALALWAIETLNKKKFVWEKTAEFGIICHKKKFTRKVITRKMTPTPKYQHRKNCNERVYNCKGTQCIHSNSKCAREKIREHVDVMAESIHECIRIGQRNETLQ